MKFATLAAIAAFAAVATAQSTDSLCADVFPCEVNGLTPLPNNPSCSTVEGAANACGPDTCCEPVVTPESCSNVYTCNDAALWSGLKVDGAGQHLQCNVGGTTDACSESFCCEPAATTAVTTTAEETTTAAASSGYSTATPAPAPTKSYGHYHTPAPAPAPTSYAPAPAPAPVTTYAPAPAPAPTPAPSSYVRCNTCVECAAYKVDPKVDGIMRCKKRNGTKYPCNKDFCCKPAATTTPAPAPAPTPKPDPTKPCSCKEAKKCAYGYKVDDDGDVIECAKKGKKAVRCNKKNCCKAAPTTTPAPTPTPAPAPAPAPSSYVRCDSCVKCATAYKTDAKVGGVQRCKNRKGTSYPCTEAFCCVPAPAPAPVTSTYPVPTPPPPPPAPVLCSCEDKVVCAVYKKDAAGVCLKCADLAGAANACTAAYCCAY